MVVLLLPKVVRTLPFLPIPTLPLLHPILNHLPISRIHTDFTPSGEPMAPPPPNNKAQKGLPRSLPRRRLRLHHNPHISLRPNRLHGVLQRQRAERAGTGAEMECGGGREVV